MSSASYTNGIFFQLSEDIPETPGEVQWSNEINTGCTVVELKELSFFGTLSPTDECLYNGRRKPHHDVLIGNRRGIRTTFPFHSPISHHQSESEPYNRSSSHQKWLKSEILSLAKGYLARLSSGQPMIGAYGRITLSKLLSDRKYANTVTQKPREQTCLAWKSQRSRRFVPFNLWQTRSSILVYLTSPTSIPLLRSTRRSWLPTKRRNTRLKIYRVWSRNQSPANTDLFLRIYTASLMSSWRFCRACLIIRQARPWKSFNQTGMHCKRLVPYLMCATMFDSGRVSTSRCWLESGSSSGSGE